MDPITRAELEAQDPTARWREGAEVYCLCPFPACADKPRDKAHRSLRVNTGSGLYNCHRCHASGKLKDAWTDRPTTTAVNRRCAAAVRAITAPPPPLDPPTPDDESRPSEATQDYYAAAFRGSLAARYLHGRGIPQDVAEAHGCGYVADWHGLPRVTFPVRNHAGQLVAFSGRACVECAPAGRQRTQGPKREGVFNPAALAGPVPIIVEAPVDALSLATCGYPAAALIGTTAPAWLSTALVGGTVYLATDADPPQPDGTPGPGDKAAAALDVAIRRARCERLRPPAPWKDWNAALVGLGRATLAAWLSDRLPPPVNPASSPSECALAAGARVWAWVDGAWWPATVTAVWPADGSSRSTAPDVAGHVLVQLDGRHGETLLSSNDLEPLDPAADSV